MIRQSTTIFNDDMEVYAGGDITICPGDSVTLSATQIGGNVMAGFVWTDGFNFLGSSPEITAMDRI